MHAVQSYQKFSEQQYVEALLHCPNKKVCTNLAETMGVSHDSMYRNFENHGEQIESARKEIENLAQRHLDKDNIYLCIDDTRATKLYAKKIEGLEVAYDGSIDMPALGITMVDALLTDTKINIPINATPFFSRDLVQSHYKTKSEIAIAITKHAVEVFKIKRMLGDAHYATKQYLSWANEHQLPYLMKIPRNRVVTIDGKNGQLKEIFRLKRNRHMQVTKGTFHGIDCYFYVIKIKDGSTIYLISSDWIGLNEVLAMYRIRWNIEIFHRTAKQHLGFNDCQMLAIEKQRQHIIFVMLAYAVASVQQCLLNLNCIEDVLKWLRSVKVRHGCYPFSAAGENLC